MNKQRIAELREAYNIADYDENVQKVFEALPEALDAIEQLQADNKKLAEHYTSKFGSMRDEYVARGQEVYQLKSEMIKEACSGLQAEVQELKEESNRLRTALEFYANGDWEHCDILKRYGNVIQDDGEIARKALEAKGD